MVRRAFLWSLAIPFIAAADPSRNPVCIAANEFHAAWVNWAERMNAHRDGVPADAVQAFIPLDKKWRRVKTLWKSFVRGF